MTSLKSQYIWLAIKQSYKLLKKIHTIAKLKKKHLWTELLAYSHWPVFGDIRRIISLHFSISALGQMSMLLRLNHVNV